MLVNVHSYYSLRYGTLSVEHLVELLKSGGYETAVLTDINNTSGALEFTRLCREHGINGLAGVEFRDGDRLLYIGIACNTEGFRELNEVLTESNLTGKPLPYPAPQFANVHVIYPFGTIKQFGDNEYIGIQRGQLNKLRAMARHEHTRYVVWQPVTFADAGSFKLHCQLRAIDNNILLSQLRKEQVAAKTDHFIPHDELLRAFEDFPHIIANTRQLLAGCSFKFDYEGVKNKKIYSASVYDDKLLLQKLAYEGMVYRYGVKNKVAKARIDKELDIIHTLGFSSYFLITWDIVRYAMSRGFYHVGRGSGANSVVAYCLRITDVCPIELDLYFERFLNPKRKSPPDFDIDFSWDQRDDIYDYIFKRYGAKHTALMGAMSTFRDKSIIRELGKVYGLPKGDIDRIINEPNSILNKNEVTDMILSVYTKLEDFPNLRTIHASGVLISELPISYYTALDMPPKGFQTAQIDMYTAEAIGFEKFDILSQRGIGHIKECAAIVKQNRGIKIDVHDVEKFKKDPAIQAQLKSGDTIGCFYVESPAMRGLLKKLKCETYLTLVAASSIIRPGVAKSGMMREYIYRFHNPDSFEYLHPVMAEQLQETYGVMVFQEDVLKVGHHFGGLDLADADVLRRMMSGKARSAKHLKEIETKYYANCKAFGYPEDIAKEVWRQIESFAGYSFSKAHSASFAVESFQSMYLKTYYPVEFMVAVINNFGGFYNTRVYVNEAAKVGGTIHLPCVNRSLLTTTLYGTDIYLGFIHIKSLEGAYAGTIAQEREAGGDYTSLQDFIERTHITLEQIIILIRIGALRFTGKTKQQLLWDAHLLLNKSKRNDAPILFQAPVKTFQLPSLAGSWIEDMYDEIELIGYPVTKPIYELLRTDFRGEITAKQLIDHVGKTVRMVGYFVTYKGVPTVKRELMAFGTFLDCDGDFFDTVHFPPSLKAYPLQGFGVYLILGKVVEEFGFPSLEVLKMAKLPLQSDPRT